MLGFFFFFFMVSLIKLIPVGETKMTVEHYDTFDLICRI